MRLTNNLLGLKKAVLALALLWTALIAVLCLVNLGKLPGAKVVGADKYVHFTFHFVFTLLWGFYYRLKESGITNKQMIVVPIISLSYGILIEGLQETMTTTRHADIFDVMANTAGAFTAIMVFIWLRKYQKQ